jgi:hypothetical protein
MENGIAAISRKDFLVYGYDMLIEPRAFETVVARASGVTVCRETRPAQPQDQNWVLFQPFMLSFRTS